MVSRLRVEVASDAADRAAVVAAAQVFCRVRGLSEHDAERALDTLQLLLDWVAQRAYPGATVGAIETRLEVVEGGIAVLISDRGHPAADFGGLAGPIPAELHVLAASTIRLRQVNLADHGTRLSALIPVANLHPRELDRAHDRQPPTIRVTPGEIEFRDGVPDDAEAIVELIYNSYGLSYGHPDFYRPEWIAEKMRAGSVLSTVAVLRGEVIGHHALLVVDPAGAVESGVLVVAPAFRGLGIVSNHLGQVLARALEVGAPAIESRAVTHHGYSQQAEHALGFRTTGLMLGAAAYTHHARSALTVAYLLLDRREHPVNFPARYADVVTASYANAGITPTPPEQPVLPEQPGAAGAPAVSMTTSGLVVMPGSEVITISAWGDGAHDALLAALHEAIVSGADVVYADLDLQAIDARGLDAAITILREHQFFYCGLMLLASGGHDHLRMQAMLTDAVQWEGLVLTGDYTRALYATVLDDAVDVGARGPGV